MKKLLKHWPIKLAGLLLIASAFSMIAVAVGATMTEQTTNNSAQTRVEAPTSEDRAKDVEVIAPEIKAATDAPVQSKEKEVQVEQPAPVQPTQAEIDEEIKRKLQTRMDELRPAPQYTNDSQPVFTPVQ